jgi:hypothetical protein
MNRRRFLVTSVAGALAVPLTAWAQSISSVRRIGVVESQAKPLVEARKWS